MIFNLERSMRIPDKSFWEDFWAANTSANPTSTKKIRLKYFFQYLPTAEEGNPVTFLEIGCYPGKYLHYFAKHLGYQVEGLDFLPEAQEIPQQLAAEGQEVQVHIADFFTFNPGKQYDVVGSFGFVEHFPQWEEVLDRHLALLKPGGTLMITFPWMRYGLYYLRRFLNPANLEGHFLEVMDPSLWRSGLEARNCEVIYCNHYRTFGIFTLGYAGNRAGRLLRQTIYVSLKGIQRMLVWLRINIPNKYLSPFVVIVARKPLIKTVEQEKR